MTKNAPEQAYANGASNSLAHSLAHSLQWLGAMSACIALAVMFGWHTQNALLIQLRPDLVPLPYNSALLMLLGSVTLVALVYGKIVIGRLLAGFALVISAVTILQYFTGIDAGIDQLLMQHYLTTQTIFPGRMAISTAFSYLLLNSGFLLVTLDRGGRHVRSVASTCAAIVIACVIATVIGYEADLQPMFGWSATTYMALHSALGIFILAFGLLMHILGAGEDAQAENQTLTAASAFIVIVTATLLLWSGLTRQRDEQLQAALEDDLHWLGISINALYQERANTLERMRRRWEVGGGTAQAVWEADAAAVMETLDGIQAMYRVDPQGIVQWAVPALGGSLGNGLNVLTQADTTEGFTQARITGETAYGIPFKAADAATHFLVIRPLLVAGAIDGYIAAEIRANSLFDIVQGRDTAVPFQVQYAGTTVFDAPLAVGLQEGGYQVALTTLAMAGNGWTLRVFSQQQSDIRSKLPEAVLVVGMLLALFLAALLHLWGLARRALVAAGRANVELLRSEQQLNQFRTTLDRTLDCVFMFDAQTFHYFYGNEGALRITGFTLPELLGKRAWELNPNRTEASFRELVAPLLSKAQDSQTFDTILLGAGGHIVPVECFIQYIAPANEPARFVTIVRDITQRKRMEIMKTEFVSTVSHELRTPLTSITGALGLVAGGALGEVPAAAMEMVNIAHENSRRLTHLINDLLDIEKLAAGKVVFDIQAQALMPLVEQAVEGTRTYGTEHRVNLKVVQEVTGIDVRVDSQRFLQILTNLLSNAIKFSPEGGVVEITVEHRAPKVRISVRDYGRGIPVEFRERIFQKFAQADASDTRKQSGTGLGLAISRELAERMSGHLDFDSVPGAGACFYLELQVSNEQLQIGNTQSAGVAYRILVVEDDADVALMLRKILTQAGYASDVAGNGELALRALAEQRYAGVILDLMLPDMSGVDIIRKLRAQPETATLPIIVASAHTVDGQLQIDCDLSEIVWMPKPVDKSRLVLQIDELFALSGKACRALHIEDDADLHQVIRGMAGPHVEFKRAANLHEARALLASAAFDVVLLDLGLPDGSGWDLLPAIKTTQPDARLIILTGQDTSQLDKSKVDSILLKSRVTPRQLLDAIHVGIKQSTARPPRAS